MRRFYGSHLCRVCNWLSLFRGALSTTFVPERISWILHLLEDRRIHDVTLLFLTAFCWHLWSITEQVHGNTTFIKQITEIQTTGVRNLGMFEFGWCSYPSLQHSTSQSVDSRQSTATYSTWLPPHFDLTFKVKALLALNLKMFWSKTSKTIKRNTVNFCWLLCFSYPQSTWGSGWLWEI